MFMLAFELYKQMSLSLTVGQINHCYHYCCESRQEHFTKDRDIMPIVPAWPAH